MPSMIDPKKLMPNRSNTVFEPLTPEVYAALKEDIAENGIQTACMVTPDFTIIAGHHRVKAALELGLNAVPVEIHDVSPEEAERLLIADNVLRRQITNPMEQARLIRRLKELHHIKSGPKSESQGTSNSVKMTEIAETVGVGSETAKRLDRLNDLIPELQALISTGELGTTHGTSLATLTPKEQRTLYDALGAERMSRLKVPDIQQAKKGPDTAALEARITALQTERDQLAAQVQDAPDPTLLETLQDQLAATEEARQGYADELARLKAQGPVERIIEKVVEVEKPVPTADPAQAQRITTLEATLTTTQAELTLLKTRRKDLQNFQQERDKLDQEINQIKNELARLRDSTNVARYRLTQAAGISQILRKILKEGLSEVPQLEALLADSQGTIFQTDRDLALDVAQQLRRASELILTAVQQFEDPMVFDARRGPDPDHPITHILREARVLNERNSIVSPAD